VNALSDWVKSFLGSVIICDPDGIIVAMNAAAVQAFGGENLIGKNALDCHPEPSRTQFAEMLKSRNTNVYTTEKKGVHKLVYQCPWYRAGQYAGLMEFALEIPAHPPHFVRDE